MKRTLSVLLALAMLFCALPLTAYAVADGGDSAIPQSPDGDSSLCRREPSDLADTGAEADAAPTGEAMRITKQPADKLYISKYYASDTHPIYPYIVFGVAGGTGVYTFDWYFGGDDEYAIGEKVAATAGPVYQPTEPGYYHCWVHDSSGDSVFCDRTLVQLDNRAQELKGRIRGTRLEWYESAATGLRKTSYKIYVSRKDKTHNTYDGMYLYISAGLDGSISDFYSHIDNYDYHFTDDELAAYDLTYDAETHMYSIDIRPTLLGFTNYDDIEYQFRLYDSTYAHDDLIYSDYLPVKKLNNGEAANYFPTNLWREGEVQINDGEYTPGSVLKPNLTCGRWAGQESKVKVTLQEYYLTEWSDVQEISGSYVVKTEDVNKRLRFKVMPKDPYERYVGELYWEKEAFYSNAVSIERPVKYITGTVNCTFTEPKAGIKASTAISFTDTNSKKYYTLSTDTASGTGLDWYYPNGQIANNYAFDGGTTYTAEVYFELINQDSSYIYNYDGLKVCFNGKEASVKRQGMKYLAAKLSYTLPDVTVIDRTFINVTKPVAGSFPTFSASAHANTGWDVESAYSMGYYENGVLWRNVTDGYNMTSQTSDESNRFEKGKRYQVTVSLVVTSNSCVFAEKSLVTGVVNGNYATVGDYNDGNEGRNIYLEYTFDLDDVIRNLSFTVSEPAIGGTPVWSVEYPSGGRYYVDDLTVSWYEEGFRMTKSDTFKAGKEYSVYFHIQADDDCKFTDETVVLVNGNIAEDVEKSVDIYGAHHARVEYTFRPSGGAPADTVLLGDADNDGKVTILDATAIQRKLAALPVTAYNEQAADADQDGKVTILDATAIQRHLASLPTNPNIGTWI